MARAGNYYRFKEAEELKQTYSSWINKMAHSGDGRFAVLKCIIIKPKRSDKLFYDAEKVYTVHFEFENDIKLEALNFLLNNGLNTVATYSADGKLNG